MTDPRNDSPSEPNATPTPAAVEPHAKPEARSASPASHSEAPAAGEVVFRVGGGTDCKRLAAAIAGAIEKEHKQVVLEFVGAGACAQAIKAVIIANTFLSRHGRFVTGLPTFVQREFKDNPEVTGMQIKLLVQVIR